MSKSKLHFSISLAILGLCVNPTTAISNYIQTNDKPTDKNENTSELPNLLECGKNDQIEKLCDAEDSEIPAFESNPIVYFSKQIDIRPENCGSFYDDYLHFRRGMRVESALGTVSGFSSYRETVSTFPVIDFISGTRGHVVKSKDLTSDTYNKQSLNGPLFDSIVKDAREIQIRILDELDNKGYLSATAKGLTTTIRNGELRDITLNVIIQASMASEYQIIQIRKAKEEIKRVWGFDLAIIEIP